MFRFPLQDGIELRLMLPYHVATLSATVRANHAHISTFLPWATPDYTDEQALEFIKRSLRKLIDGTGYYYGVFAGAELIGGISFNTINTRFATADVGYWLAKDWNGRGIITDALRVLTDYGFGTLGLQRIEVLADVENVKSGNIPLRVGYQFEATRKSWTFRKGAYRDMNTYVALASEWENTILPVGRELLSYPIDDDLVLEPLLHHHGQANADLVASSYESLLPWLPWASPDYDVEKADANIERYLTKLADNDGMGIAMMYQGQFAGWACYLYWNYMIGRRTEIGYWIGKPFEGKGIVTRTVKALTDFAFGELGLNRAELLIDVDNEASNKVPQRLGFEYEGVRRHYFRMNGIPRDTNVYYKLAIK